MSFMNFKIVNAENLQMKLKEKTTKSDTSTHWDSNHQLAHRDIKEALWKKKKNGKMKFKIQEKHLTLPSILMFSPEFNLEKEFCIT